MSGGAQAWALIAVIGAGTFALRFSFLGWLHDREPPAALARLLRYVPPAVLTALVLSALVYPAGESAPRPATLLAAGAAALVAWRTRSVLWTLVSGMVAVLLLTRAGL